MILESNALEATIRQQPEKGRKIGFAKSGSFLYPELIIEYNGSENAVCHVSVDPSVHYIRMADRTFNNLEGTKIQAPKSLHDPEDGKKKLFFIFSDLRIRIKGEYNIYCNIVDFNKASTVNLKTNTINVYNLENFGKIQGPSKLTKSFAIQGVRTAGRRYNRNL